MRQIYFSHIKRNLLPSSRLSVSIKQRVISPTVVPSLKPYNTLTRLTTPSLLSLKQYRSIHSTTLLFNNIKKANRLIDEKSPYLLQHAHNPVDWYPWGEQAFQKAKLENKPIFLSIGYSTCHWCHVMENESFENEEVAKIMNDYFVNIKVDREENPGVDKLYMTYVQLTAGRGGWPMSVFLTPDLEPFFGGTYFHPNGFKTALIKIAEIWQEAPQTLRENAQDTIQQLKSYVQSRTSDPLVNMNANDIAKEAFDHYKSVYDTTHGGFNGAPKFPQPVQLNFLLEYFGYAKHHSNDEYAKQALDMVQFTLKKVAAGGIHDHVGQGFHRYSTDKLWHVPHFEKMLYDQAQLLYSYSSLYQITKDSYFATVAKDIINYVKRDLGHAQGGFYSAEDADSLPTIDSKKKLEGAFCVWTKSELESILNPKQADVMIRYFGIKENGNVDPEQDPHSELTNKNVLTQQETIEETANALNISLQETNNLLEEAKEILWKYRMEHRPRPHRDDKIITAWNGLMISGLAKAYQVLQDPSILDLAINAATFIKKEMYHPDSKTLIRSYRNGASDIHGFVDDYSYLIQGLLDLYEANFDEKWVQWAFDLQEKQNDLFYDKDAGGYFTVQESDKSILVRMKEEQDGAEPSPNAISLKNLVRLGTILENKSYVTKAQDTLDCFNYAVSRFPYAMPALVSSFLLMYHGVKQVVLAGNTSKSNVDIYRNEINHHFIPNKLVILAREDGFIQKTNDIVSQISASQKDKKNITAFICQDFTCGLPINDLKHLKKSLTDQ
ncbi:spermatogenesis-associated protein 20 [Cunninghamella echinulata]|nr:spermatogenesis-associated protein 20 [Cunninghamella echinulata]